MQRLGDDPETLDLACDGDPDFTGDGVPGAERPADQVRVPPLTG